MSNQLTMFAPEAPVFAAVTSSPEIDSLLRSGAPVAFGVSGGDDSALMVLEGIDYLNAIGHKGPRILIHADLGRTEWADSMPSVVRLAAMTGLKLEVVRWKGGDMIDRWEKRWEDNCARYAELACVRLIKPWSDAKWRFCTKELKTAVICSKLTKMFPNTTIINAVGLRWEESDNRSKMPIWKDENELRRVKLGTYGVAWHPVMAWKKEARDLRLTELNYQRHEAYTVWGMGRVSCNFCFFATKEWDLSASDERNQPTYHLQVGLEIRSTYSFVDDLWLADARPDLLSEAEIAGLAEAKARGERRRAAESRIPKHLEYTRDGWPTVMPTQAEAVLLGEVRREVAAAVGLQIGFTEPGQILARYAVLMRKGSQRTAKKARLAIR